MGLNKEEKEVIKSIVERSIKSAFDTRILWEMASDSCVDNVVGKGFEYTDEIDDYITEVMDDVRGEMTI